MMMKLVLRVSSCPLFVVVSAALGTGERAEIRDTESSSPQASRAHAAHPRLNATHPIAAEEEMASPRPIYFSSSMAGRDKEKEWK